MLTKAFPKPSNIVAEKCAHRFDADATFTEQTDTVQATSIFACEMYGFRHNFRLGANVWNLAGAYETGQSEREATGLIRHDIYFASDYWKDENGQINVIPDYYATTWTALGVAAFEGAVLGVTKISRFPNHGQELFDISNGKYGYDIVSEEMGTNDGAEFTGIAEFQLNWFRGAFGRQSSVASDRNGQGGAYLMQILYFLAVRSSGAYGYPTSPDNASTYYGPGYGHANAIMDGPLDRAKLSFFHCTSRSYDAWSSDPSQKQAVNDWTTGLVTTTCQNKGWFRDFIHWHQLFLASILPAFQDYLLAVKAGAVGYHLHTCSNGEAIEYLFLREITQRVNATEFVPGKVNIIVDVVDWFKGTLSSGIPNDIILGSINTPLSVRVDLSNSSLAGKNVKASSGKMRNRGGDIYIVEVPFSKEEGFSNVIIQEGSGGYFVETQPVISKAIVGTNMTVTTDIPTKCVVFEVATGGNDFDSIISIPRSNELSTTHKFTIGNNLDYRIGAISDYYQTSLLEP